MEHALLLARLSALVLGSAIASLTLLGSRRNRDRFLLALGLGFSLIAVGAFVELILFDVLEWDLLASHTVESGFVIAGLGVIVALLRPRTAGRGGP